MADEAFEQKKADRRAARRSKGGEEQGTLNLTSLMDVVSIIVVYLLKNYGTDPVVIAPTAGQKVPMSTADSPVQDGVPIYISARDITFGSQKVVQLNETGDVDPTQVQKHSIIPLYEMMAEEADKAKQTAEMQQKEWTAQVILIGDENLKFSTLVDVMYTAGQAEYSKYLFCVIQKNS